MVWLGHKRNVQALWPVLERTLATLGVLPARTVSSVEELHAACGKIRERLIDATEREHVRPQDDTKQRDIDSGKKRHAVKKTVIATRKKWGLFLGKTVAGSIHEYPQFTAEFPADGPPADVVKWFEAFVLWLDVGYWGIHTTDVAQDVNMPHKSHGNRRRIRRQRSPTTKRRKIARSAAYEFLWNRLFVA